MNKNNPLYQKRKAIVVDRCDTCPFNGKCKPWTSLSRQQRVALSLGINVGAFILKGCPLPDGEDNAEAFKGVE